MSLNWDFHKPAGYIQTPEEATLTQAHIDTILRALGVCAAENASNAELTCNANLRQFYRQKAREYEDAYNAFYKFVGKDPFFASLDRALDASAECLDCPDPACTVCADMKK